MNWLLSVRALLIAVILVGCGAEDTAESSNSPPVISGTAPTSIQANQSYQFTPTATDADGDTLTFSVSNAPAWSQFDPSTGMLSGTPGGNDLGDYAAIVISVSDGTDTVSLPMFSISVLENPVNPTENHPPQISGTPPTLVQAGESYQFTPIAADPDGDPLTFQVNHLPGWINFNPSTGQMAGTPEAQDAGDYQAILLSVTDGRETASLPAFTIHVSAPDNQTPGNLAPQISGTPSTSVEVESNYEFLPMVADADNDPLIFSIQQLPSWCQFDTTSGRLSGVPGVADIGTYAGIVISVSDGIETASLSAFSLTVVPQSNPIDDPPVTLPEKRLISPSDFTFIGGFRMPSVLTYTGGLTLRYISGALKAYSTRGGNDGNAGELIEFDVPQTLSGSFPFATVQDSINFGDIYQDKIVDSVRNGGSCSSPPCIGLSSGATPPTGIFWDEVDQRMYWTKVVGYNTTLTTSDTSIGYSTLDDTLKTGTGIASWKLDETANAGGKGGRYGFSMASIPADFAAAYLNGQRLAVGFGGGVSIVSNGVPSIGPAIFSIATPSTSNENHLSYLSVKPKELLSHFYQDNWAVRNAAYPGLNLRTSNTGSTDLWFLEDQSKYGVWIDYGGKTGVLTWALMGAGYADTVTTSVTSNQVFSVADHGDIQANDLIRIATDYNPNDHYPFEERFVERVEGEEITLRDPLTGNLSIGAEVKAGDWYAGGGPSTTRYWTPLYIYNPVDLANTATDPVAYPPNNTQPTSNLNFPLLGISYPRPGTLTGGRGSVIGAPRGMAFDDSTGRLYMAASNGIFGGTSVWVYQLGTD